MLTEKDIKELLEREPIELKPLIFVKSNHSYPPNIDFVYDVTFKGNQGFRFVADIKARATSQALAAAAQRAKSLVFDARGSFPLVIVPYLSPASLDDLEKMGISAVDLCGNGIVQVPNQWFVLRSGRPNRFRGTSPLRGTYRGAASLVGRAFVARAQFDRVSDVLEFILSRGGKTTLATVSKALARLEEDLVIARDAKGVRLLQKDKLLARLLAFYQPPTIRSKLQLKAPQLDPEILRRLKSANDGLGGRLVLSGISSASRQTVFAAEPITTFYCSVRPEELAKAASLNPTPARHFANLELLQTDDQRVYFDARDTGEVSIASPVQTWLELTTGDKRSQEVSEDLLVRMLRDSETGTRGGETNG
jgi:hypothetical protein